MLTLSIWLKSLVESSTIRIIKPKHIHRKAKDSYIQQNLLFLLPIEDRKILSKGQLLRENMQLAHR